MGLAGDPECARRRSGRLSAFRAGVPGFQGLLWREIG